MRLRLAGECEGLLGLFGVATDGAGGLLGDTSAAREDEMRPGDPSRHLERPCYTSRRRHDSALRRWAALGEDRDMPGRVDVPRAGGERGSGGLR